MYSESDIAIEIAFCNTVIKVTNDYDELSEHAKNLTEKIYTFIKQNNEM